MMNGMIFEDNMSNLTSGSNELASISSSSRNEVGSTLVYPQKLSFASTPNQLPAAKKKRNLPGNPDPDAEVVALSPRTLMATNRFICEICNKGFQRDQNLQLHRRGHNLPWKLKQRANKEEVVKKKVYVCPEATCVHHEPSRALGDLTGIKKHFSRKHGEKKWKCEKCSKRYAVRSDWKAHSKICGTREYRCDCGTLFSRRDSFITHRAFCDALAEESTRSLTTNPLLSTQQQQPIFNLQSALIPLMKREQDLPQPWLASQPPSIDFSSSSPRLESNQSMMITHHPQNPNPRVLPPSFQPHTTVLSSSPSHHMSATALLQKAAQMSAIMSSSEPSNSMMTMIGPHQADDHMIAKTTTASAGAGLLISSTSLAASAAGSGAAGLSSPQGLSFGNKPHANVTSGFMEQMGATTTLQGTIHDMMIITTSLPSDASSTGFGGSSSSSFEEAFNGMFNPKMGNVEGGGGGGNEGLSTRDFLGLRGFSHRGFSTMAGFDQINSSPPFDGRNQN